MSLFQRIQDLASETTKLLLDANAKFNQAIADITHQPNSLYTADRLTDDVTSLGVRLLKVWLTLGRPLADPTLPTISMAKQAPTIVGGAPIVGVGSLSRPVDVGVDPTVTKLVFIGFPDTAIPVPAGMDQIPPLPMRNVVAPNPNPSPIFLDALRQQIQVDVDVAAIAAQPQQGIYQGYVLVAQDPIAVVVMRVL